MKDSSILPSKGKKFVRIDHKTFIEVDENIPNEVAIVKFKENISCEHKPHPGRPSNAKKKAKTKIDLEDSPDPDNYSLP